MLKLANAVGLGLSLLDFDEVVVLDVVLVGVDLLHLVAIDPDGGGGRDVLVPMLYAPKHNRVAPIFELVM